MIECENCKKTIPPKDIVKNIGTNLNEMFANWGNRTTMFSYLKDKPVIEKLDRLCNDCIAECRRNLVV